MNIEDVKKFIENYSLKTLKKNPNLCSCTIPTALPYLSFSYLKDSCGPVSCVHDLGLIYILSGFKKIISDFETYNLRAGDTLLTLVDVPTTVSIEVKDEPFISLYLKLDHVFLGELFNKLSHLLCCNGECKTSIALSFMPENSGLKSSFCRLIELLSQDDPIYIKAISPIIIEEIATRLILSKHGDKLCEIINAKSNSNQIFKAVSFLKKNYKQKLMVDDLANMAHMSPSSFRQHFKEVCGMSPVQYQKMLRLHGARNVLFNGSKKIALIALDHGYESISQFTRDYRREFGLSPLQDLKQTKCLKEDELFKAVFQG